MADLHNLLDGEIKADFFLELEDLSREVERYLLLLEEDPDNASYIRELFRPFHTIKGNAGLMGEAEIQQLSHLAESILDEVRQGRKKLSAEMMEGAFKTIDVIRAIAAAQSAASLTPQVETTIALLRGILAGVAGAADEAPAPVAAGTFLLPVVAEDACRAMVRQLCELERMLARCKRQQDFQPFLGDMFDAVLTLSDRIATCKALAGTGRLSGYLESFLTVVNLADLPYDATSWQLLADLRNDIARGLYPVLISNLHICVHYYNTCEERERLRQALHLSRERGAAGHMVNINTHTPPSREEIVLFQALQQEFSPGIVFVQRYIGQKAYWKDLSILFEEVPPIRKSFWQALEVLARDLEKNE